MRQEKNVRELLQKFIKNDCDEREIEIIIAYFKKVKGTDALPSLEEVRSLLEEIPEEDSKRVRATSSEILKEAKKREGSSLVRKIWKYGTVAAMFIGLITLGYFYQQGAFDYVQEEVLIPSNSNEAITLELEDGSIQEINSKISKVLRDAKGNLVGKQEKSKLVYNPEGLDSKEMVYNTLRVPYGKTFSLILADGTYVYLNAGTKFKYPQQFNGDERKVFLEGEAYFEVTKNQKATFLVNTLDMNVQVLGTRFNVSAYANDPEVYTVLVEGAVSLYNGGEENVSQEATLLEPGQMGAKNQGSDKITLQRVDVQDYLSWMGGKVVFHKKTFKEILKVLERKYNVRIENHYAELNDQRFKAIFDNETIEQVMRTFTESRLFKYSIQDNVIIIEKP